MKNVLTKGNVIVNKIKVGDIHYEYEYGLGIKSKVITLPKHDGNGYWEWKSKNVNTNKIIDYGVREDMSHYGPNLYDCEAYICKKWI